MNLSLLELPADYVHWLANLKQRIHGARQRALLAANSEQIRLYHDIGREILERQSRQGWGAKVIDRLSADLRAAFPNMKGLSASNLKYMRYFAEECPERLIGQQSADQLAWFHIVTLITKLADPSLREWYAREALAQSWPRDTLSIQIKDQLHLRKGAAVTNFDRRLTSPHAGLATQILKDPYHFDFLGLGDEAHERDIQNALMRNITQFLLELGFGFAFVGRQFRLEIAGDEFFIDLLFYHTRLKCYVVVELKALAFKPEHAGQLNFYLSAVDAQIKASDDAPTIGLLLCRTQNRMVAEYALHLDRQHPEALLFHDSIIVRSGQSLKALLAPALVLIGGFATFAASFLGQYIPRHDHVIIGLIAMCILFGGAAYGALAIRCPGCEARWIWQSVSKESANSWLIALMTHPSCPVCNWPKC